MAQSLDTDICQRLKDDAFCRGLFLEAANEGYVVHEGGTIYAANENYARMFGYDVPELLGANALELIDPDELPKISEYVRSGYEKPFETIGLRRDGSRFPCSITVRNHQVDGHLLRCIAISDITEQKEKEATISEQSRAIMDISTPAIEVWDGILLMPLIGAIDTARASQVATAMLESIAANDISIAILDLTGVPVVDTGIARHLLQTVASARLLGADVIVSGFGPESAQTLAQLGVDLSSLHTAGALKSAVRKAFSLLGQSVATA